MVGITTVACSHASPNDLGSQVGLGLDGDHLQTADAKSQNHKVRGSHFNLLCYLKFSLNHLFSLRKVIASCLLTLGAQDR